MKLIVFGATGTIGQQVVQQALAEGHEVTAFVRNPSTFEIEGANLNVVQGNVLDAADVAAAVPGHDGTVIALGAGRNGGIRANGTRNVVDAMTQYGIRRLVALSTLGAGDSHHVLNFWWKRIMFGLLLRPALADHEEQEAILRASDLDWVIVRPGAFTDGPVTDAFDRGVPTLSKKLTFKASRADIGRFMVRQLTSDAYLRQTPPLSY